MRIRLILFAVLICAVSASFGLASPPSGLWIDVPYVAQSADGCGSASISMVMQYWTGKLDRKASPAAEEERIQQALFSPKEGGIPASAMQKYFAASGYRVFAFEGTWQDLRNQIEQGRPLIVSLRPSGLSESLHYVVVAGIDPDRNYLYLNDPARQKMLRISREGFESEWHPTHHWTLLAVPLSSE
ncbi:MAG TPA: C39 family peptidase [Candidatus Acidoferrales bacterium]|nr:C39 family peptidase [Candidatus Acidoferrales bacterium]